MKVAVIMTVLVGLVAASTNQLSEQELEILTKHLETLQKETMPNIADYTFKQNIKPRIECKRNADCPLKFSCIDIPSALYDVLNKFNALIAYNEVTTMLGIKGGECAEGLGDWINDHGGLYFSKLTGKLDDINDFINRTTDSHKLSSLKFIGKMEADSVLATPIARSSYYTDPHAGLNSILPLFLLMQSGVGSSDDNGMLIYFLLMSNGMTTHGPQTDMAMNPLFLLALTSDSSTGSSSDTLQLILLMSLFDTNSGMGSVMPFFLINALGEDGKISDILPILLLSNMFNTQQTSNNPITQLLPLLLMNLGSDNNFIETFLLMTLVSSISGDSGFGVTNELLPLLLLMSGGNSTLDSNFLMTFLMITFFGGAQNGNDILPLLFLLGDGGIGSSGLDISTLAILMSLSNLGAGGISSLLPILMMSDSDSSTEINDIILISLLRGGNLMGPTGDIMNLLLPILLSQGANGLDSTFVVMLMLFSSSQQSGVIPGQITTFTGVPGPVTQGGLHYPTNQGHQTNVQIAYKDSGFNGFLSMFMMMMLLGDTGSMDVTSLMMMMMLTSGNGFM